MALLVESAEHLTPVILELGGKSPLIIDSDTKLDNVVPRICWGKFVNCGQTCIAPDYALVARDRYDEFVDKMKTQVKKFYGEDPSTSTDYGKMINQRHTERVAKLMRSGGKVAFGGVVDVSKSYISPTLLVDVDLESEIMKEEIFGPVLPIVPVDGIDQAIDFINSRPKPLALYVFSQNQKVVDKVLSTTTSGGGCVNDCILHNICKEMPFGGVGESGMGAYNGKITFDTFTHQKSFLVRTQASDPDLRFPPYTPNKLMWLQRLQKVAQFFSKFSSPFKGGLWSWGWWALFVAVVLVSYFYFPRGFH
eukprot:TRINITY_DN8809_c0_g1_i6.p1 TRINITY_DN8809_c0_g1~~TRINITY_DN8809_c0_g1_i6.p1  ORF type:complete len:307 (+),score=59.20 TRINITY_DN8809_c0_g1_i6:711-1631(+)